MTGSGLREAVLQQVINSPDVQDAGAPEDEIVAAMTRQVDVLEGSLVVLASMAQVLLAQVAGLRAELALFNTPVTTAAPYVDPEDCGHPDRLWVDTAEGRQKVCPTCNP